MNEAAQARIDALFDAFGDDPEATIVTAHGRGVLKVLFDRLIEFPTITLGLEADDLDCEHARRRRRLP